MKILYPMAKKVIANSIDTAKDISNYIKITEEKIVVINNPLVSERLYYLSQKPIGDHHFCRLDRPLIISIGRLVTQKNFNFLIESFLIVKKRIPSANLIILGKGPLEYELKNLAIKLNLEDSVHFLGFIENPYNFLKASDVFVLSSLFEGFGNVLVEALSVGVPIVSTDCAGGPREILDNGLYGKLVPLGDKQFMADAIIDTINNKPKALQLLNRSKNYGIKSITDKYLKEIIY